ncbi:MAG: thioesterase [Ponticaulis sp.]|nr:thioesterase [Ponticaulis sp.]
MTKHDPYPIPDGFEESLGRRGPFTLHNGPVYRRRVGDKLQMGLRVLERHCNGMGFLHGGMAAAFADSALATIAWETTDSASVTMRLSIDYLNPVRLGDWLMAEAQVAGVDGDIVHVDGQLTRNERQIVCHAVGVFHLVRRKVN